MCGDLINPSSTSLTNSAIIISCTQQGVDETSSACITGSTGNFHLNPLSAAGTNMDQQTVAYVALVAHQTLCTCQLRCQQARYCNITCVNDRLHLLQTAVQHRSSINCAAPSMLGVQCNMTASLYQR